MRHETQYKNILLNQSLAYHAQFHLGHLVGSTYRYVQRGIIQNDCSKLFKHRSPTLQRQHCYSSTQSCRNKFWVVPNVQKILHQNDWCQCQSIIHVWRQPFLDVFFPAVFFRWNCATTLVALRAGTFELLLHKRPSRRFLELASAWGAATSRTPNSASLSCPSWSFSPEEA